MRLIYNAVDDSLYVELSDARPADQHPMMGDVVHVDASGVAVAFTIGNAGSRVDLSSVAVENFNFTRVFAGS